MALSMRGSSSMQPNMDSESLNGLMTPAIMDIGKTINSMVRVSTHGLMVDSTLVIGLETRWRDWAP